MDKKQDEQEPVLDITDDLKETKPSEDEIAAPQETSETPIDPVPAIEAEPTSTPTSIQVSDGTKVPFMQKLKNFLATKQGKVIAIVAAVALVIAVLLAIPVTRYGMMGVFVKKDVSLTVLDSVSKKPVSGAMVTMGTYSATSNADGVAKLEQVPVGNYSLQVQKKYYEASSASYTVPILSAPADSKPTIKATGRTVTITVKNKITGGVVSGAAVVVSGSSATTDSKGAAEIILPVQQAAQKGTVKASNYNDAAFEVTVTNNDDQKVAVSLAPSGKIFFLSKRTGKIDVMKSDLDGANPETVVAGTGKESDSETVLLSTTDWKYLALLAARDSDKAKLYLIDTSSGKLSTMDEGDVSFQLVGWSGHQFVYQVTRSQNLWADKRQALKSFNAENSKLTTLDETQGSGNNFYDYATESLANQYIVDGKVVYTKSWDIGSSVSPDDRQSAIVSIGVGGSDKKNLKNFAVSEIAYFDARFYEPGGVYYRASARTDGKGSYYEYEDGKLTATADTNDNKFYNEFYATYLISPSGNKTLWYEQRDGKNVIFVGDKSGNNAREIGVSDHVPYGWYTDDYILFSLKGSELYVMDANGKIDTSHTPLKITDYHKPAITYPGYGGGYGGQ